ncbi:hypothetical protein jhhlp_006653 [Lomentospora prolificans]|uniref:Uncharacterized protein n=1 Tax=Lomentospora prolificans TaxID=41688 RepID=A0A2N3N6H9_9PEZI|nr:hypothetical protein jhhlp_006653 [Lomentospora prolificans]
MSAAIIFWVLLNVASQLAFASMSLTYSLESNWDMALLVDGNISLPIMENITTNNLVKSEASWQEAQEYTANRYGLMSLAFKTSGLDEKPSQGQLWYSGDPTVFCEEENTSAMCTYVFHETSPQSLFLDDYLPVKASTNRSINATVTCESWVVVDGGNGTTGNITIKTESGDVSVQMPPQGRPDRTIFMLDDEYDCGEGCSVIQASEFSDSSPWFYKCNVTVGSVANATRSIEEVSLNLTTLASAAIALRGFASTSSVEGDDSVQYAVYPAETVVGYPNNGSVVGMALTMSRFAVGVIAFTAENNAMATVNGREPTIGTRLHIEHWDIVNVIFILTIAVQLLLGLANLFFAHKVVIPSNGLVDEARILRPMMKQENPDSVISMQRRRKQKDVSQWIYRNRPLGDGVFDLYLEER